MQVSEDWDHDKAQLLSMSVVVIVGATASGKSSLAVEVAVALRDHGRLAEVVNADSMLLYRGMDIGTAKPTQAEQQGIPHHLIDVLDLHQSASVAWFQQHARAAIADIRSRGGVAVVVGGSALYLRAIIDHFDFPGQDLEIRARWQQQLDLYGAQAMHAKLADISPESAAQIEPGNARRIVRALEVAQLTGGHRPTLPEWSYALQDVSQFGLEAERALLDQRIEDRVEQMWAAGLVSEVRHLMARGLRDAPTASKAIGYAQTMDFLDGSISESEAIDSIKRATRKFHRRQLAWYRRDPRIHWLNVGDNSNCATIVAAIS